MRKPALCICKNKDANQLRSNCAADQRLCFRNKDTTIPLLSKSEISSSVAVQSGLCRTSSETPIRFSHNEAHLKPHFKPNSFANNKGAYQPVLPRSLICAFVVSCLEIIVTLVCIFNISSPTLVSETEQPSLRPIWSGNPTIDFLMMILTQNDQRQSHGSCS